MIQNDTRLPTRNPGIDITVICAIERELLEEKDRRKRSIDREDLRQEATVADDPQDPRVKRPKCPTTMG